MVPAAKKLNYKDTKTNRFWKRGVYRTLKEAGKQSMRRTKRLEIQESFHKKEQIDMWKAGETPGRMGTDKYSFNFGRLFVTLI